MLPSPGMAMRGSDNEMCQDINGEFRGAPPSGTTAPGHCWSCPRSDKCADVLSSLGANVCTKFHGTCCSSPQLVSVRGHRA
jgi:hypothetical protein